MNDNLRIDFLNQDFAEKYCYGCPFFRHDAILNQLYCRRKIDKILCDKMDQIEGASEVDYERKAKKA